MTVLPSPDEIAALVSNVTHTMCGTSFAPGDPLDRGESLCTRMAMIALVGEPNINVVVASDAQGSRALGAAFLGCRPQELTLRMIDDVTAELLNMVAGQISAALGYRHSLGLPQRTTMDTLLHAAGGRGYDEEILLRSQGRVDLGLWLLVKRTG